MEDKEDGDSSPSLSPSISDSEDVSDNERNDSVIPSIPSIEPHDQQEDSTAVDRFLEQVAGPDLASSQADPDLASSQADPDLASSHADPDLASSQAGPDPAPRPAPQGKGSERQRAKRTMPVPECRCQLNGGRPCHTRFRAGELAALRGHYLTLGRRELDVAVLAKLECGIHLTTLTTRKKCKPTTRKKHRTDFYHRGFRICNVMFVYLHGFSYKKLKALIVHYKTNGVRTRVHKNMKPRPPDTEPPSKRKKGKTRPNSRANEQKPRKTGVEGDNSADDCEGGTTTISPCQNSVSLPESSPPLPPPPPQPAYVATFPLTTHTHHPHAPLLTPTHPSQASLPPAVGYDVRGVPVFAPATITVHPSGQPQAGVSSPAVPSVDYGGQPGLTHPALDCSGRGGPHMMASFPPNPPPPCLAYSVLHSVTF